RFIHGPAGPSLADLGKIAIGCRSRYDVPVAWARRGVVVTCCALLALSHGTAARSDDTDSAVTQAAIAATSSRTPEEATVDAACPADMVEVDGEFCAELPEQRCLRWMTSTTKGRCAEFAPSEPCIKPTVYKRFCVDRYEYPNREGVEPAVMK